MSGIHPDYELEDYELEQDFQFIFPHTNNKAEAILFVVPFLHFLYAGLFSGV